MAKKIEGYLKLNIPAGGANPSCGLGGGRTDCLSIAKASEHPGTNEIIELLQAAM